ncbi:Regulator of chromosome condensation/beta-lactamase-inhibitor protein II [Cordyceps fumosorosea ARSEF 2679]|uniref:Regulator of chromosome condensation/beta-lactamase-inhibitor protein II n=1 Tax=Cordyceps fumosorosea (strain ARSEF 2679) TaxID=1081104 RepID=A0A168B4T5_CORFA|nr:Regulator of chromosome condensation/beta-lactamase-inhibitor protein II [Cordyceps fumosorosea ARSEF 2679]OAA69618.1 Regulator of chromosome condensation/beta-lactamase-inhibitor protein II [Cordyceps fumosorosea ARSEF 2679]
MATPRMALYAAGSNCWGQLDFQRSTETGFDLTRFTEVISANEIERPKSGKVYSLARVDGRFLVAAHVRDQISISDVANVAFTANGNTILNGWHENFLTSEYFDAEGNSHSKIITLRKPAKQVVAYDTGFVILYEDGVVATMGDARFYAPLGRTPSPSTPADEFADVDWPGDLDADPVKHITACGWMVAALTESGAVYLWGQDPPSLGGKGPTFVPGLSPEIGYAEIDGVQDVADFALGETHAIALLCDGHVYVVGNNVNGQLGIPSIQSTREWTRAQLLLPQGSRITGVAAGPNTSFILVSHGEAE